MSALQLTKIQEVKFILHGAKQKKLQSVQQVQVFQA